MSVWVNECVYVCKSEWLCMNECVYVYVCESMSVWVNECVYECVYVCVNQCMSVHEWVCMCVRVKVCVSVCEGTCSGTCVWRAQADFSHLLVPSSLFTDTGTCCWGWLAGHLTLGSLCLHPTPRTLFTWLLGSKPSCLCGKCSIHWAIFQPHRTDLKVRIHPDSGLSSFYNVLNDYQGVLVNNGKFQINLGYCFALFIQEFFFSEHRAVPNVKYEWQTVVYIYTSFSLLLWDLKTDSELGGLRQIYNTSTWEAEVECH